jgi:hypothetical protein
MFEWFYTGNYRTDNIPPSFSLREHIRIHGIAAKYQISDLVKLSSERFSIALRHVSDLEVYFAAVQEVYHQCETLAAYFASTKHFHQGKQVELSRSLCDEVVDTAVTELHAMLKAPLVAARFHQVLADIPAFHMDFLHAMLAAKEAVVVKDEEADEEAVEEEEEEEAEGQDEDVAGRTGTPSA